MKAFVTTELFPFTHGGIGRAIANILSMLCADDASDTAVVWVGNPIDATTFAAVYPHVKLVTAASVNYELVDDEGICYPPEWAFTDTEWHWRSVSALQGLKRLVQEVGEPDYIEFPDWGGLGFATIQEKLLGRGFSSSVLSVRLHSADSLLASTDARPLDKQMLAIFDLERKALADCDRVVAQLPDVGRAIQQFFGFSDDSWVKRLCVHAPPVELDNVKEATRPIQPTDDTPIVFPSKIQHLKRPDLFLRGACGFLLANPQYRGSVVFAAHSSPEARAKIERMVPSEFKERFLFLDSVNTVERMKLIARSISVTASPFESYCLSAYEASLAGAICVLNGTNPAFNEHSPWRDRENCYKFDGTAQGLATALTCALRGVLQKLVEVPRNTPPWMLSLPSANAVTVRTDRPLVSVIVPHFNLGAYLPRTLDSVLASTYENVEIVVVDDCSTDELSRLTIERLQTVGDRLRIVRNPMNLGLAATRNVGLNHASGEFALTLDSDDLISPSFIETAVNALQRNPAYDFVVPQTGFFLDTEEGHIGLQAAFTDYAVFYGEARAMGLYENRFSTATCVGRLTAFRELRYREELEAYEDWDLYSRAVAAGKRFIVTNGIHFFYRRRADSMYHTPERALRHRSLYHSLLSGKMIGVGEFKIPCYALEGASRLPSDAAVSTDEVHLLREKLAFYQNSLSVYVAIKAQRYVSRQAPWATKAGRKALETASRLRRRLRS